MEGKGEIHSYGEVHQAIQPSFRPFVPYAILLVDLDTQKGEPTPDEALRVIGNLVTSSGEWRRRNSSVASASARASEWCWVKAGEGVAIPQWAIDDSAAQPAKPWRYAQE